jgi:flagellar biosynthetic protein FlhB
LAEDLGERTEQPTSRRKGEARSRGQIAKSQDLVAVVELTAATVVLVMFIPWMFERLVALTRGVLDPRAVGSASVPSEAVPAVLWGLWTALGLSAPVFLLMFVFAVLANVVQTRGLFTLKLLRPKFGALNPVSGARKLFGKRNLVRTGVSAVKLAVVIGVAALVMRRRAPELMGITALPIFGAISVIAGIVKSLLVWILSVMFIIALADYLYQLWQHNQDLKMTKQEVEDERRSMEGDTSTKAKRFRMAREMLMQRMRTTVPTADVIVTNPTHYAVALKYDESNMGAPKVVAKGADYAALRIRAIANEHGIPIVEKPPLARGLYRSTPVGKQIAPQFYQAVAEVLAYVYRVAAKAA